MKHTASKPRRILSLILATLMLAGLVAVAIPVSADEPVEITPNTNFEYNGIVYRFDVVEGHTDSFARILPDGTVEFQISNGDMLWFPGVTMGENSKVQATLTPVETMPAFSGMAYSVVPNESGRWDFAMVSVLKTAGRRRITNATYANLGKKGGDGYGNGGNDRAVDRDFTAAEKAEGSAWYQISNSNHNQWDAGKTLSFVAERDGSDVTCIWTSPEYGMLTSSTYSISEKYPWNGSVGFTVVWQGGVGEVHHAILNAMSVLKAKTGANTNGNFYVGDATKEAEYCGLPIVRVDGVAQKLPYTMQKNTEVTVDGIKLRFDSYYDHGSKDTGVVFNADGTITARLVEGDLLWMPDVKVDATSTIHTEAKLTGTNAGGDNIPDYSELHGFGPVWNVTAEEQWGLEANKDTDKATIAAFRSLNDTGEQDGYISIAEISAAQARDAWSWKSDANAGLVDVRTSNFGKFGSRIGYNATDSAWNEVLNTTVTFADGKITAIAADEDGLTVGTAVYDGDQAATLTAGPVGFMMCYGKYDSVYEYTFNSFVVKNAVIGDGHSDVCLVGGKNYVEPIENYRTLIVEESTIEIETGIAFFTWKIALTEYVPTGAKLVMKKNGTTVNTVELNTLTPDADGICTVEYYLNCESEDDVLTLCLEVDEAVVAGSETFYEYGAAWEAATATVAPVNSSELNCKAYEIDFSMVEDMTLVPGENIVAGHRWIYVKNSEDGFAKIENGKLRIKGSKGDMIIFDDLNLNKTNFRFVSEVTYLNVPQVASWDDTEAADVLAYQAYNAYFGHLVHLSDADADGNRTAFIQSCTPNGAYVMGATINPNAEEGSLIKPNHIGEGDAAYDDISKAKLTTRWYNFMNDGNVDIQYFNGALGYGTPMSMYTLAGTSNNGYGKIHLYAVPATGSGGKLYGNMAKKGASFTLESRVGKMGYICSEDEVEVSVGKLYVDVKSTSSMTVDGEQFPIYGGNEITVASLAKESNKVIYAQLGDEILYPESKFTPNRLTVITTKQVNLVSRKATAVGQTGLRWKFEIDKAGFDALLADPNVASVKVGMLIIPTTFANEGINRATFALAGSQGIDLDITASKTLDDTVYVFNGVRDIAKNERTISYSAVGYIQVTLTDDHVVEQIADFSLGKLSNNLISLVGSFDDEQEPVTDAPEGDVTTAPGDDVTTTAPKKPKKGCKSTVTGFAMIAVLTLAGASCACFKKKD